MQGLYSFSPPHTSILSEKKRINVKKVREKKRKEKEMNTSLSVAEEFLSVTDVTARTSFESVGRCHNKLRRPK